MRASQVVASLILVVATQTACSFEEREPGPRATQDGAPLTQDEVDSLDLPCQRRVASLGTVEFQLVGVRARAFLCDADERSPGRVILVERGTSKKLDLEELGKAEASEYARRGKVPAALRAQLEASADSDFTVDLWLRQDHTRLINKEEIKARESSAAAARAQLAASSQAAVRAFLDATRSSARPTILSDKSRQEHLPVPILTVRARASDILLLAEHEDVSHVSLPLDAIQDEDLFSENYMFSTRLSWIAGVPDMDGTDITVANLEGSSPDSWVHLFPSGPCTTAKCACLQGKTGPHSRSTQGVLRNTVTGWGGTAADANVIAANFDAQATPACSLTEAVNWAVGKDARVLSRSAPCDYGAEALGKFLDLAAVHWPYPLVVCAAGNAADHEGSDEHSRAAVYNGIAVTGAEPDTANRGQLGRYKSGRSANREGGDDGWELPHIAAPSRSLDTANSSGSTPATVNATSAATPVVSGIAASLMELNPAFAGRPEVIIPTLMVTADKNVDDDLSGVWPLNLHDGFDDHDGAGVVNALGAYLVGHPTSKRDGGSTAAPYGHAYGYLTSESHQPGVFHPETYTAMVAPGETLRVALMLMASPICPAPATETNCSSVRFPWGALLLFPEGPAQPISINYYNSVQFASWHNTSGSAVPATIRFAVVSWRGQAFSYWGLAWTTRGRP